MSAAKLSSAEQSESDDLPPTLTKQVPAWMMMDKLFSLNSPSSELDIKHTQAATKKVNQAN